MRLAANYIYASAEKRHTNTIVARIQICSRLVRTE